MTNLVSQISALASSVAGQFKAIASQLVPTGGTSGQVLTTNGTVFAWQPLPATIEEAPNDSYAYVRQNGAWVRLSGLTDPAVSPTPPPAT